MANYKNKKKIGILLTNFKKGGIAKLCALMANDIANKNNQVTIFVPILPYYTFYFKIFKRPFFWIFRLTPDYLKSWISNPNFPLYEILDKKKIKKGKIQIKYFLIKLSNKDLYFLDLLF